MSIRKNSRLLPITPFVIGTVHSPESLRAAQRLAPGSVDLLELRVDAFAADPEPLLAAAARLKIPRVVTVRHPAEGGAGQLSMAQRRDLYRRFLPHAAFIDTELRSARALASVIAEARALGTRVILSAHDFRRTPTADALARTVAAAEEAGADICKIATLTRDAADLSRLVALFAQPAGVALSVMGMGPLGKVSRILFARLGSVLNYGYLHRPNAPGQWEARTLKVRIDELSAET